MGNKENSGKHSNEYKEKEKTKKYKINKASKEETSKKGKTTSKNSKGKKGKEHPVLKRVLKVLIVIMIIVGIILAGLFAGIYFGMFGDDFKITKESLLISGENSKVVDSKEETIAFLVGDENREIISLAEMPKYLPQAFISIEDERFYDHQGVDIKRTAAATVTYVIDKVIGKGSTSFGGSTITQQLVKNLTKEKQDTPTRKIKEMSKAFQVERLISKDQILELYLNLIFLGDQAHGVQVASQYYFSKQAKDLTVAESAYLAGINHVPNAYRPFDQFTGKENPEEQKTKMKEKINKRTKTVLVKMKELGYINDEQYNTAIAEVEAGLAFKEGTIGTSATKYSYHTAAAIDQVVKDLMEQNGWDEVYARVKLKTGGYTIHTTQDSVIQARMEEEFKKEKYQSTKYVTWRPNKDGVEVPPQASMVIIDHATGKVVGLVGGLGSDVNAAGLNRALTLRSTGSSMKSLSAVGPGLEAGILTGATVYEDSPTTFNGKNVKNYNSPKGAITIRSALETSQNIPQAKAITELGPIKSIEFLRKAGFKNLVTAAENPANNDESYSLALGGLTKGASTLEMAAGYAMIANDGEYITPILYTKVTDKEGKTIVEPKQERTRVMSVQNAYILQSLLTQPVVGGSGTARSCKIPGMDVAAKTGTTNDDKDRWLCGFTGYYAAATWYGFDWQSTVSYRGSPSNPALGLWIGVMKDIHTNLENKKFDEPADIVRAAVCTKTGLLPGNGCDTYTELFVKGTVPTETCEGAINVKICTETGLIANEYCEHIEERMYHAKSPKEKNVTAWNTTYVTAPEEICTIHTKKADTVKPVITLKGSETITIKLGEKYTELGATAKDAEDGDLTEKIEIDISKLDVTKVGTYTVTYSVSDKAGNKAVLTRTVKVVEKTETEKPPTTDKPETPSKPDTTPNKPETSDKPEDTVN